MSSDILAYLLLKVANLSGYHQLWTRATMSELKWGNENIAKENIWGDVKCFENPMLDVKVESINKTSHEEVLFTNNNR